jgi:hypothetical protein
MVELIVNLEQSFKKKFQYTALSTPSSFRLLSIENDGMGSDALLIRIRLQEYDVNYPPDYKALSYTWAIDRSYRKRLIHGVLKAPALVTGGFALMTVFSIADIWFPKPKTVETGLERKTERWMRKEGSEGEGDREATINPRSGTIQTTSNSPEIEEGPQLSTRYSHEAVIAEARRSLKHGVVEEDPNDGSAIASIAQEDDMPTSIERIPAPRIEIEQRRPGCKRHKHGSPTRLIICNGKQLRIGLNLYNALREIPSSDGQLWWIDAVCIDQSNIAERGVQVDLMAHIYGNAEEVVVWLGQSSPFTQKAASFLDSFPTFTANNAPDPSGLPNQSSPGTAMLLDPNVTLRKHKTKWIALFLILRRAWFKRVWVLQEAMLAKKISFRLGNHIITQEALINGMEWLQHLLARQTLSPAPWYTDRPVNAMMRRTRNSVRTLKTRDLFRAGAGWQLEDYLDAARGRDCTDDRDIAFAGFSLVKLGERDSSALSVLKADYTKPVAQVYQECAGYLLQGSLGFKMLSLVEGDPLSEKAEMEIPSWVPDLRRRLKPVPLWTLGGDAFRSFQPEGKPLTYELDGSTLHLRAVQWDEINMVGETSQDLGHNPGGILNILSSLGRQYSPTGEATMTALWRTFVADLYQGQHPAPSFLSSSFLRWSINALFSLAAGYMSPKDDIESLSEIQIRTLEIFETHDSKEYPFRQAIRDVEMCSTDFVSSQSAFGVTTGNMHDVETEPIYVPLRPESLGCGDGDTEHSPKTSENLDHLEEGSRLRTALDAMTESLSVIRRNLEPFMTTCEKTFEGRRIFLTEKGYLGIAPTSTNVEDSIMLVEGSYVPYIFRKAVYTDTDFFSSTQPTRETPAARSEGKLAADVQGRGAKGLPEARTGAHSEIGDIHWILVGEAYVHGIMHGEAILGQTPPVKTIHVI